MVLRSLTLVIGDIESVVPIPCIIARRTDIPSVLQIVINSLICCRVQHPTVTLFQRLKITGVTGSRLNSHHSGEKG